jgi:hypothetical protein
MPSYFAEDGALAAISASSLPVRPTWAFIMQVYSEMFISVIIFMIIAHLV